VPDRVCAGRVEVGVKEERESPARKFATVELGRFPLNRRYLPEHSARVLSASSWRTRRR
jgi:hypothetical protein